MTTNKTTLQHWLMNYAKEDDNHPYERLTDIATHGCISGVVSPLIYTSDCISFYHTFEAQIWDTITDFIDQTGQTLGQFLDSFSLTITELDAFKTQLSWFAIEQTAYHLLNTQDHRRGRSAV